jgi:FAD/FMN-containing dehydrogenase
MAASANAERRRCRAMFLAARKASVSNGWFQPGKVARANAVGWTSARSRLQCSDYHTPIPGKPSRFRRFGHPCQEPFACCSQEPHSHSEPDARLTPFDVGSYTFDRSPGFPVLDLGGTPCERSHSLLQQTPGHHRWTKCHVPKDDATPLISAFDPRSDLSGALRDWRALLGDVHVLADEQVRDHYARSTSSSSRRPAAILKPGTRDEVVKVVRIARRCRTPLYPISTGQNWGYGDACAVYDGQVIVDLGRMNRIEHVDTELGYAVIEPGVTQGQLSRYLAEQGVPFWIDCTGAGPNSSFIGNIVERGFGHSPYGNRFETISGMEVVLGTGEVLRTGFGHYPGAKTTHLYPYGIGPYLDGIFTQSNFGIVTQLGLWLQPIPESFCPYIVLFKEDQDLLEAIPRLQKLRLNRILQSVPHIGNDLRAFRRPVPPRPTPCSGASDTGSQGRAAQGSRNRCLVDVGGVLWHFAPGRAAQEAVEARIGECRCQGDLPAPAPPGRRTVVRAPGSAISRPFAAWRRRFGWVRRSRECTAAYRRGHSCADATGATRRACRRTFPTTAISRESGSA